MLFHDHGVLLPFSVKLCGKYALACLHFPGYVKAMTNLHLLFKLRPTGQ